MHTENLNEIFEPEIYNFGAYEVIFHFWGKNDI